MSTKKRKEKIIDYYRNDIIASLEEHKRELSTLNASFAAGAIYGLSFASDLLRKEPKKGT